MSNQSATHADAELILKLYDLRRESEMRKARNFFLNFWPTSAEDVLAVIRDFGSQENAHFRQVIGYWEMAASFAVRGVLNDALFYDSNGELFFIYCKLRPFVKEIREKGNAPEFLKNVEALAERTPEGRQRIARIEENFKRRLATQPVGAGRNGN
jgi:hypothetical protein